MAPNFIWWWGSNFGALWNLEDSFVAIVLRFTLTSGDSIYESNRSVWKLSNKNTWYCVTVKSFVWRIVTWNYNHLLRIIIISYLKPYVQTNDLLNRNSYLKPYMQTYDLLVSKVKLATIVEGDP